MFVGAGYKVEKSVEVWNSCIRIQTMWGGEVNLKETDLGDEYKGCA